MTELRTINGGEEVKPQRRYGARVGLSWTTSFLNALVSTGTPLSCEITARTKQPPNEGANKQQAGKLG